MWIRVQEILPNFSHLLLRKVNSLCEQLNIVFNLRYGFAAQNKTGNTGQGKGIGKCQSSGTKLILVAKGSEFNKGIFTERHLLGKFIGILEYQALEIHASYKDHHTAFVKLLETPVFNLAPVKNIVRDLYGIKAGGSNLTVIVMRISGNAAEANVPLGL